ncbi:MAG: hypothetical protein KC546_14685, partial [Anaerolineae bacterium]|nr:hypothetical protein [Anaerolineae bacterium]
LQRFLHTLRIFNEDMARDWDALQSTWEEADKLWRNDDTRRRFDNDWQEMGSALRMYRERFAEEYEEFLLRRKWALDEYFDH